MNRSSLGAIAAVFVLFSSITHAQVPPLINYQGRVVVGTTNFDGSGQLKFALVNAAGTTTYWSNDGTSVNGSQPTNAVTLTVTKGLYSVLLGDTSITNMTAVPGTVFTNSDVRLRVWFNDGSHGSQLLTPDQRIATVGYTFMADNIKDGAITSTKLGTGAVGAANIANGAVGTTQLAPGALSAAQTIAGTTQTALANTGYAAASGSPTTVTVPGSANVGDVVQVSGAGAGGWAFDSWAAHLSNSSWRGVASSADGTKLVAVINGGQIQTSTNSGGTWTPQAGAGSRAWGSVASSADGTKLVATVFSGQIYTSTDSGVTWTAQNSGSRNWNSVASSADGTKLVAGDGNPGQIYTSTDSGVTWTPRPSAGTRLWISVASSADGTKLIAAVLSGQIYTSTDSGVTWTPQANAGTRSWESVASSADGNKLVAADESPGKLYTSTDSGVTWTPRDSNRLWQSVASSFDGNKLVAVADFIYTSTDSGVTWAPRASNRSWSSVTSSADGIKVAATVSGGQIYTGLAISGTQGSNATVQYLGNGVWQGVGETQIAPGAVGSTALGVGAVGTANIANGAVSSANIANAAVTSTQLASGLTLAGTTMGTFNGNGSALTNLNASNIISGTLPAAQLPAVVALRTGGNNFTGFQTITGDFGVEQIQAAGASNSSFMEFDDSTGGTLSRNILGADGNGFSGAANQFTIGTWTNTPLAFYTNQTRRVTILGNGNVGIGTPSPGVALDVAGAINVPFTTSATNGVYQMGGAAFLHAPGSNNLFLGFAGNFALTGAGNIGIGSGVGGFLNTGTHNTAIGFSALSENANASDNTAVGWEALKNSTGGGNTIVGSSSFVFGISGSNNSVLGFNALNSNNGSNNIAIGKDAGSMTTTGASNDIYIGSVGAAENNTMRIGTSGTHTATFIAGINGVTLSPTGAAVFVNSNGQLGTVNSSRRFKTDIEPMDNASDVLLSLKPVTFHYKPEIDAKAIPQFGLIAEEVAEVCPDLVIRDEKGEIQTVRYEQVNAMLLNEFLKEHRRIAELREENATLRSENAANAKRLATLETRDKEREARLTRIEMSIPPAQAVSNTIAMTKAGEQ